MPPIHFDPLTGWQFLPFWFALGLGLALFFRRGDKLRRSSRILLIALDTAFFVAVTLLLLNPALETRKPKPGAYRQILLLDRSGSMSVTDGGESRNRLRQLRETLAALSPELREFLHRGKLEIYGFAGKSRYLGSSIESMELEAPPLPGGTAIGDAMYSLLKTRDDGLPLSSIVLFSDGRNVEGFSPLEAAKLCKHAGIPVTCVPLGKEKPFQDLAVAAERNFIETERDCPFNITVQITNTFSAAKSAELQLLQDGIVLDSQKISLEPGSKAEAVFNRTSHLAGSFTYMVKIPGIQGDSVPENNADFINVRVTAPPVFRILSILGGLDWEQRFINQFTAENSRFETAEIIMTGKDNFLHMGFRDEEAAALKEFPDTAAVFRNFDAVVLDTRAVPAMKPEGIEALKAFAEHKGGGLLLRGPLTPAAENLAELLPVREVNRIAVKGNVFPEFSRDFIFSGEAVQTLTGIPACALTPGKNVFTAVKPKSAARSAASLADGTPILCGMAYGAGRVAYTGIEDTWQWRLSARVNQHNAFWNSIFNWLCTGGKPQVQWLSKNSTGAGEDFLLDLAICGDDFLPAANAQVTAEILEPDGSKRTVSLGGSWEEEGRFSAEYIPPMPGQYNVDFRIELPERTLTSSRTFIARQTGAETDDMTFNGTLLRDIARITGGSYLTPENLVRADNIPVSGNVPVTVHRLPLTFNWIYLVFVCALAFALWGCRRNFALK